jgi:putative membrane protein
VKAPTAGEPVNPDFKRNHLLQILLVFYLALWAALAISPLDRADWLLENLLVFVFAGGLAATYRRFPLSDLSYVLIALFFALQAVGAHYTYAKAPLGFWLKDAFDLNRNHFDRIVHFSFGLLLGYPIRETLLRVIKISQGWIFFLAFHVVLAWSGMFELLESWVAQIVSPELGPGSSGLSSALLLDHYRRLALTFHTTSARSLFAWPSWSPWTPRHITGLSAITRAL